MKSSPIAAPWQVLSGGLDRLELWAWRPTDSPFPVPDLAPGETWGIPALSLVFKACPSGTRNHLRRFVDSRAGVDLAVDARKKPGASGDGCRRSCGDVGIRLLSEWCHAHRGDASGMVSDSVRGGVAALLGLLGCDVATARVARVDPHVDFTGPDLVEGLSPAQVTGRALVTLHEADTWGEEELEEDAHKGAPWRAYRTRVGDRAVFSGFRCGCSGGKILRVYRKDIEARGKGSWTKYQVRYPGAASAPATWRVEWEARGDCLTEYGLREWKTFHVRIPGVLRRWATRTRVLESGWKDRRHTSREALHPLWQHLREQIGDGDEIAARVRHRTDLGVGAELAAKRYRSDLVKFLALSRLAERNGQAVDPAMFAPPGEAEIEAEARKMRHRYVTVPRLEAAALSDLIEPADSVELRRLEAHRLETMERQAREAAASRERTAKRDRRGGRP